MCIYIFVCFICLISPPTPLAVGVSELMVHPVLPNYPNAQTALILSQLPDSPNSPILRLPDSQTHWILRASVRTRLSILRAERPF